MSDSPLDVPGSAQPFTMLGDAGVVCDGDTCIVPGLADDAEGTDAVS